MSRSWASVARGSAPAAPAGGWEGAEWKGYLAAEEQRIAKIKAVWAEMDAKYGLPPHNPLAPYPRSKTISKEASALSKAIWQNAKARKAADEVAAAEPLWASLDEAYRLCVLCQNLANILHERDTSYDPTETPWYIWMLTQGRYLDSLETYLFERGWIRPEQKPLNKTKAAVAHREVFRMYKRGYYAPRQALPRPPSWSYSC